MNYRSIANLNQVIVQGLPQIPRDIDLVVGVPRSGLLAANMLALHLNSPLTDLKGLMQGRLLQSGRRMAGTTADDVFKNARKVLLIDDSINSGGAMREARRQLEQAGVPYELMYAAVYVTEENRHLVDLWFEVVPTPRVFEWNVMHQDLLGNCCVDIDGVLCRDPTPEENDDGEGYWRFLVTAEPLFLPTVEVGALVTARLEKYRELTEQWLGAHGVRYRELVMLDLPSKAARLRAGSHGRHKADAYLASGAELFIESDPVQAAEIAERTGKPVLCIATRQMVYPGSLGALTRELARRRTRSVGRLLQRLLARLLRRKPPAVQLLGEECADLPATATSDPAAPRAKSESTPSATAS